MTRPMICTIPTYCDYCYDFTIDIFNMYNKPLGYPALYRNFDIEYILDLINKERYPLAYMRCTKCNRIYIIDWSKGLPMPLKENSKMYSKYKGKAKTIKS